MLSDQMIKVAHHHYLKHGEPNLDKTAGVGAFVGNNLKNFGRGTWNLMMGGKTLQQNGRSVWKPFHGINNIGRAPLTHQKGFGTRSHKVGLRKIDPQTGEPLRSDKRSFLPYLKGEFAGARPTRGDMFASMRARKMKISPEEMDARGLTGKEKNIFGGVKKTPRGVNVGEYLNRASGKDRKILRNINNLGMGEFIRKHPGVAAKLYGAKAMHGGFLAGLPAYETYNVLANKEGIDPDKGAMSNLGATAGTALGFLGTSPVGLLGSSIFAEGLGRVGAGLGSIADRAVGNKALKTVPDMPVSQQPIAKIPTEVARNIPKAVENSQTAKHFTHPLTQRSS